MIYIAIQINHSQKRWIATTDNRPMCLLIFIEEPEVHLHAQVQQVFINQVTKIIHNENDEKLVPQIVITTHSSHILEGAEFSAIRYFQRVSTKYAKDSIKTKVATKVHNLALFDRDTKEKENLKFLTKYLKLNHCDLFFSDAAILVEGTVERLLMPKFIEAAASDLQSVYLTTLEVGGAYAHRFIPLLNFIGLPTLIITDLDSVDPQKHFAACRADTSNSSTSNKCIQDFCKKNKISDLLGLDIKSRTDNSNGSNKFIAYQGAVLVTEYGGSTSMIPRTFEESFIYENMVAVRQGKLNAYVNLEKKPDFERDYSSVYETVKNKNYRKVDFALSQIETEEKWKTPDYIIQGLSWLKNEVCPVSEEGKVKDEKTP